ncbi:MAG: shikimate kinase [Ruminococcus sp.]
MKKGKNNLILIGMPAVGKSTVGVILAKELGYQFLDSDLLIQQKEGKLLKDIIASKGAEGFISVENSVNASIEASRSVIATGGSVVYGKEAMRHLQEIGEIIYLKISYACLEARLHNLRGRGVVLKKGQTLYDIYKERTILYEKYADDTIDVSEKGIEETLEEILVLVRQ